MHANRLGGLRERSPVRMRKQDVPRRHRLHAGLAQAGGYAWPASPKPMNATVGVPFRMVKVPPSCANGGSFGAGIAMAPVSIDAPAR